MDYIKTPKSDFLNENKKDKIYNNKIFTNRPGQKFNTIYSKFSIINDIKPADPLINRKIIKINPAKFPTNTPTLELPYFNHKSLNKIENFNLIPNNVKKNNNNINNKDIQINNYINMNKMIQKLVYTKKPPDKDGHVTIENIINLNYINSIKERKKRKPKNDNENKLNDNTYNIGISSEDIINFESNFESGNLQLAYLVNSSKENTEDKNINNYNSDIDIYQLFLQNDTNTTGYSQWFFFRVKNGKKNQKINLNIMNFQRKTTKYSLGIKIWYYSKKKNQEKKIGWEHTSENVEYYQNFLYRFIKGKRQYYYSLSFDYTFEYDDDEIYFANSIPYTYSDMIKDLNEYTKKENEKYYFYQRKILCSTITGNDVDYFNINNNLDLFNFEEINNKKRGIVLFARQHPGETVGNWVLKGAIELLMGDSDEAKYLRNNFIIKIIPMVNVDGVICGNSRTSLAGCDLNRRWVNPNEYLHPEICYLKELIYNFTKKIKVDYIIDFHGHFGAFNSFFYANNNKDNISLCKNFPFICGKISKIIQFNKSRFKMPKYKKGTGRIDLYRELNIENVVTLETSYFGCNEGEYSNQYFNIDRLKEIGRDICNGILLSHYNSYMKDKTNEINIENININYKKTIENKLNKINSDFEEYINGLKNKINISNNNTKSLDIANDEIETNIEQNENENENESDSESQPSRDNLEEEEIKVLLPFFKKRKNIKKTKKNFSNFKKFLLIKKNSNNALKNNNQPVQSNKLSSFPKIDNSQATISKSSKIVTINHIVYSNLKKQSINSSNKFLYKNRIKKYSPLLLNNINSNKNSNCERITKEDKQTQTEEKFFKLHWSTFFGIYKIMSARYEDKKVNESFSFISLERKINQNNNLRNINSQFPSSLTSFNHLSNDKKNESQQIYIQSRNNLNIKKNYYSDYNEKNNYLTKYIKRNNQKYSYNSEKRVKEKDYTIKENNKIKEKGKSIQKVIKSFISNITSLNKNDFLKRYLSNEERINEY